MGYEIAKQQILTFFFILLDFFFIFLHVFEKIYYLCNVIARARTYTTNITNNVLTIYNYLD